MHLAKAIGVPNLEGCYFGLEVEVEGMYELRDRLDNDGDFNIGKYWRVISDGSLRNGGVEIVCRKPVPEAELNAALNALRDVLDDGHPEFSARTSTHVHVNVRDMTLAQVIGMYMLYSAYEPVFQRYVQQSRRFNLFCLPMGMCTEAVQKCMQSAWHGTFPGHGFERLAQIGKYSSVNTGRVADLGTLEFRAMHGADDLSRISQWCTLLSRLRTAALQFRTLDDVFMAVVSGQYQQFIDGLTMKELPGGTYCTVQQSMNTAASILSSLKTPPATNQQYLYWEHSGDMLEDARHALDRGLFSSRQSFRSFIIPSEEVIALAAAATGAYPFEFLDMLVIEPGVVAFKCIRPDGRVEYTCVHKVVQTEARPEVQFIINRR